ncbi:bifunctional UDP-N-acetylglucosamine diphosphorylase/glucosamine-1-phosphate N-acetyltransferase GlmU [Pseudogracilibacillus sp. SO30301A]|uniref:bifunctional UDP-N-acetylglucosamine diphosphorylase/glucosamine-1-phosphate N-acetyltransferase GlmU n=1 Tax=Pseudogracilibacillus sp. SO30301A TaxID=3098291 RepID=UPI00300E0D17
MKSRFAIILAAGQGTRMKSKLYKVLHPILGRPMIQYVIEALKPTKVEKLVTVIGHGAEKVKSEIGNDSQFVLQEEQLGTAHAVMQAEKILENKSGTTIVVCGDTPLITAETFDKLFEYHERSGAKATVLTTNITDPTGYGRVIRGESGDVERIVEHKDASDEEKKVKEINTGTYCFDNEALFSALKKVNNDNAQQEYYLPDVIEILKSQNEKVSAFITEDDKETIGINDRIALSHAENIMKIRINEMHLKNGVTIMDPTNTYIDPNVTIEPDVVVYPGSMLMGDTHIGTNTIIGPNTEIENCTIGQDTVIKQSVLKDSNIGREANIGPFAHIRPETTVGNEVRIGNFVELKKSVIGDNTKIPHLSYIGDANLGNGINIGCGTITVNYDGKEKHVTTIEDNAFIGCNSNLVAPVTIKKGSYVAAGSTITNDVPVDSLAIARSRQTNKKGYAAKMKK